MKKSFWLVLFCTVAVLIFIFYGGYFKSYPMPELTPVTIVQATAKEAQNHLNIDKQGLYNPYRFIKFQNAILGGFHYHHRLATKTWPAQPTFRLYQRRGLNFINWSDYNHITNSSSYNRFYIPTYEHGLTLWPRRSHHFTAIGIKNRLPILFPFAQTMKQLQQNIYRLKAKTPFLVLNHPSHFNTYTPKQVSRLTHLNAIEVLTPYGQGDAHWDALLSEGHLVWGVAAPDIHNPHNRPWAARYLVLFPTEKSAAGVLQALRLGHYYFVWDKMWAFAAYLTSVQETDEDIHFRFSGRLKNLRVIGENGSLLLEEKDSRSITITKKKINKYARIHGSSSNFEIMLNPIIASKHFSHIPFSDKNEVKEKKRIEPVKKIPQTAFLLAPTLSFEEYYYIATLARGVSASTTLEIPALEKGYDACTRMYQRFYGLPYPPSSMVNVAASPLRITIDDALNTFDLSTQQAFLKSGESVRHIVFTTREPTQLKRPARANNKTLTLNFSDANALAYTLKRIRQRIQNNDGNAVANRFLDWAAVAKTDVRHADKMQGDADANSERVVAWVNSAMAFLRKRGPLFSKHLKGGFFETHGGLTTLINSRRAVDYPQQLLDEIMRIHMLTGSVAKAGAGVFCNAKKETGHMALLAGATPHFLPFLYPPQHLKAMNRNAHFTGTDFSIWRRAAVLKPSKVERLFMIGNVFENLDRQHRQTLRLRLQKAQQRGVEIFYFGTEDPSDKDLRRTLTTLHESHIFLQQQKKAVFTFIDPLRTISQHYQKSHWQSLQALDFHLRRKGRLFSTPEDLFTLMQQVSEWSPADISGLGVHLNTKHTLFWPAYKTNTTMDTVYRYRYRYQQHVPYPAYGIGPGYRGQFYSNGEHQNLDVLQAIW